MADTDADAPREPEVDVTEEAPAEVTQSQPGSAAADAGVDRTELKVQRARLTLEEEAEAARRRVLGVSRGRLRPAAVQTDAAADDEADLRERLREMVRGVEDETDRLQEDVFRLRSAAGRAGTTLHEEIRRAADELAEETVEVLETTVGQTATESLEALTEAVGALQETTAGLQEAAGALRASVENLGAVAPVAQELAELAAAPPAIPEALAAVITDLTEQLSALGEAVSVQVRSSLEEVLAAELGRHEARIEHALARLVDELARLRRRLPVTKRGAAIDLTKEQLTAIGQSVGDYLLAAMREQKS
jgi:hypothetical protein